MRKSHFSEEQIIGILKEHQAGIGANRPLKNPAGRNGFPLRGCRGGSGSWTGCRGGTFARQAASSFGSLARLQAAIVSVNRARTRSMPRYMICAMPPTVFVQPNGSSIFFLHRWDLA